MTTGAPGGRASGPEDLAGAAPAPAPEALIAHWRAAGVVPERARWQALGGGRSNALWRIEGTGAAPLVCKLFRPEGQTPLFGNDPAAEAAALTALAGTGLAPALVAMGETPAGPSVIYRHVAGQPWRSGDDPAPVARALRRLHGRPLPAGLADAPMGAAALIAQTRRILAEIGADLPLPEPVDLAPGVPVFLHGDATAGNALVTPSGVVFIDWQCPARGDATEDLATFLSPAMQILSGNSPLSPAAEAAFLTAYEAPEVVSRYRDLAPAYHARMAAYCLWRAARGEDAYRAAAEAELARFR